MHVENLVEVFMMVGKKQHADKKVSTIFIFEKEKGVQFK